MNKPIHTPGPLEFLEAGRTEEGINRGNPLTITEAGGARTDIANVYSADDSTVSITREEAIGNARLLAAAYNAFDSAAKKLGVNAVELAERMQDAGICDLVQFADKMQDYWTKEECPHHIDDLKANLRAILAKVRGAS